MVASANVGRMAATLLRDTWDGVRIVELDGPRRITPGEIAATFSHLLGRTVRIACRHRETRDERCDARGMRTHDGADAGESAFEAPEHRVKGSVPFETVLRGLIMRAFESG